MTVVGQAGEIFADSRLIEAGARSSLVTFGQLLQRGSLVLKSQDFIHSSAAARNCLQQLRRDGVEVALSLSGRISGTFSLALDNRAALQVVTALVGEAATTPVFNELARSALKEAGNVVASAFLGALESLCGSGGLPGLPALQMDSSDHIELSAKGVMYALPVTLVAGTHQGRDARGGIFINLHNDDSTLPSPAL